MFIQPVHHESPSNENKLLDLCEASVGAKLRVHSLKGQTSVCQRLREMGFCEFAEIQKVADNGALICQVCGCRVALSRGLAKGIIVQPVPTAKPAPKQ